MKQSVGSRLVAPALLGSPRRRAALALLFAILVFGALVQGGVLAPHLTGGAPEGGGPAPPGNYTYSSVNNESWRAWTVTDIHLGDGRDTESFAGGGTLRLTLYPNGLAASQQADPVDEVTVEPGQQFGIGVDLEHRYCTQVIPPGTRDPQQYAQERPFQETGVPIFLAVATPLGTRTITESIVISCPPK
jgi:hypothetical protein